MMHPVVALKPGAQRRMKAGHPWIYSNEVVMDGAAKALPPGGAVVLLGDDGRRYGTALFNPHALVAARLVDPNPDATVDVDFFARRLAAALALRDRLFDVPCYRVVHAEADGLPGLVVDRYGAAACLQINGAGMELYKDSLLEAVDAVLAPTVVVVRADSAARTREGLDRYTAVLRGAADRVELQENGARYVVDLAQGQKTGWFYDQRRSRDFVAGLAPGGRVLDVYSCTGAFGILAALRGAAEVTLVDRSAAALAQAAASAMLNGVAARCRFEEADAFEAMTALALSGAGQYDLVIVDPPSFVPSKKAFHKGARAYRRMTRLAAALVRPGGFLFAASCSHNMPADDFAAQAGAGLTDAGRTGRILRAAGAGPDHPVHPALPETAYLKSLVLALD